MATKTVYCVTRYTSASSDYKRHAVDWEGLPLCGARSSHSYEHEDGEVTCKRCLAKTAVTSQPAAALTESTPPVSAWTPKAGDRVRIKPSINQGYLSALMRQALRDRIPVVVEQFNGSHVDVRYGNEIETFTPDELEPAQLERADDATADTDVSAVTDATWWWKNAATTIDSGTGSTEWLILNTEREYIGSVATPEIAAEIVSAHNDRVRGDTVTYAEYQDQRKQVYELKHERDYLEREIARLTKERNDAWLALEDALRDLAAAKTERDEMIGRIDTLKLQRATALTERDALVDCLISAMHFGLMRFVQGETACAEYPAKDTLRLMLKDNASDYRPTFVVVDSFDDPYPNDADALAVLAATRAVTDTGSRLTLDDVETALEDMWSGDDE